MRAGKPSWVLRGKARWHTKPAPRPRRRGHGWLVNRDATSLPHPVSTGPGTKVPGLTALPRGRTRATVKVLHGPCPPSCGACLTSAMAPAAKVSATGTLPIPWGNPDRTFAPGGEYRRQAFAERSSEPGLAPAGGDGRGKLCRITFGTSKINLHQAGKEFEPKALRPTRAARTFASSSRTTSPRSSPSWPRPASPSNRARWSAQARPGRSSAATCATRTTT